MAKRKGPMEEVKKSYVRMALESGNYSFTARKVGVSPSTLSKWIRQYRDEVEAEMAKKGVLPLSQPPNVNELQAKYDQAMKLLGEKELEVAMLRDMLKKKFPDFPNE
ncbi:transposase [Fictibacillus sp. Mic-4]|uniref:transposase n=1 Tax=Fictibacillus sp. Mic-4 TaxID=3132826 RepID=UPI001750C1A6|nr:transposase [Escherichia coli]